MQWLDLDIRVRAGKSINLTLPNGGEIAARMEYDESVARRTRDLLVRIERKELNRTDIRSLGEHLQTVLLPGEAGRMFAQVYRDLATNEGLRVRIIFERNAHDLEVYRWPWEYLYHSGLGRFLATDPKLTLSRYDPPGREGIPTIQPEESLNILVIVSEPKHNADGTPLGGVLATKVVETICKLKDTLLRVKRVEVVERPTRTDVRGAVESAEPHIVHFIGHGTFDDLEGKLALVMQDGEKADWCTASDFSSLFSRHPPYLVILQACESGAVATMGSRSVAAQLVHQHNLPAVVAMQYEITNQTAIRFAECFYKSLVEGAPVDFAVQTAREAITYLVGPGQKALGHSSPDFGIPVLFMRSHEPVIGAGTRPESAPRTEVPYSHRIPHRKRIAREYVGDREKVYEQELRYRSVIGLWGNLGIGKTWTGARLAIQWEESGFSFSPYPEHPQQVLWFKCEEDMGFSELATGIGEYLEQCGEESFGQWYQSSQNRTQPARSVISRLTELLNREQYFLCFDNFHHVSDDEDIRSLFKELEQALDETATKVILIGQTAPGIQGIGGRELRGMTRKEIQQLVLRLRAYDKGWLNRTLAAGFADRLIGLVGMNPGLMEIVAINWLRNHTTPAEAQAYLDSLNKAKIAELILGRGDKSQIALLTMLSILDEWEELSTLIELGHGEGMNKEEVAQTLEILRDAGLIQEDEEKYGLIQSVRKLCIEQQIQQPEKLSDLHQRVAEIYAGRGDLLSAFGHYLKAEAFSEALQLILDNMLEITRAGGGERASKQLGKLQVAALVGKLTARERIQVWMLIADFRAWLLRLDLAQSAVEKGLQALERIPEDERSAYKYEEGRLKGRLGVILAAKAKEEELEQLEESVRCLNESQILIQEYMEEHGITVHGVHASLMVLNNLGIAYRKIATGSKGVDRTASFSKAVHSFEACINECGIYEGVPHVDYTLPWAWVNLSQAYDDRKDEGDQELALKAAHRGLEGFQKINHQWGIGFANRTLGTIYLRLEEYENAEDCLQQGRESARRLGDRQAIILSSVKLAEINILRREWPAVDQYLETAREVLDKVAVDWMPEYVSYFERWAEGVKLLEKGQVDEGERILRDVLAYFSQDEQDYHEAECVEGDLPIQS
ncbi:MAG: CHAT domain-containing protein [Anaerolineae bacterium]|nr:CHAT domain-containing protein [Anaerolineae bacterium]